MGMREKAAARAEMKKDRQKMERKPPLFFYSLPVERRDRPLGMMKERGSC